MLQLKTIRRPRVFWPGGARTAQQEEIRLEVREMGLQAKRLRELVEREIMPGDRELEQELLHLCNYLDGDAPPDNQDEFGIECPNRWEPWYTAHLFRCAVHLMERDETILNPGVHRNLAASLAGLSVRVMHLQETPLARKTLDTAMRGELW